MKKTIYRSNGQILIIKCNLNPAKICDNCNECIYKNIGIEDATNKEFFPSRVHTNITKGR